MAVTSVLRPKHHELINLHFLGRTYKQIAEIVGMSQGAIYCIINSPLAQAELAQMQARAKESVTNVPLRATLSEQLNRTARKSLNTVEGILDNPLADLKTRARVSQHILDRVVFDKNPDDKEGSYRDILRKLDEMSNTMMIKPQPVTIEGEGTAVNAPETIDSSPAEYQPRSVDVVGNASLRALSFSRVKTILDEEDD